MISSVDGFTALHQMVASEEGHGEEEFIEVLKYIASWALKLEEAFPDLSFDILVQGKCAKSTYSNEQVRWAIAHGFFSLIEEYDSDLDMPTFINFSHWMLGGVDIYEQKLRFYYEYFRQCRKETSSEQNNNI